MKSQKLLDFGIWDLQKAFGSLGPRRRIKPLTLEPWLQFSQTGSHFLQNH